MSPALFVILGVLLIYLAVSGKARKIVAGLVS